MRRARRLVRTSTTGLRRNGVFVDPRREHARQPPGEPIPAVYLTDFGVARDEMLQQFSTTVAAEPPAAETPKEKQ